MLINGGFGMLLSIALSDISGGIFLGGWETAALTALMISFGIIAIAFAIGIGFGYRELEEWAKNEMYEIFISGLIVVTLIALINILFGISINLAGGNPFSIALSKVSSMIVETNGQFLTLLLYNIYIGALSTLKFAFFIPIPILPPPLPTVIVIRIGSYVTPWAGLSSLMMGLDAIFNVLGLMIAALLVEQVLLTFIQVAFLKYFLPLGILMRTFPITRVAGGTLIAIAIGAYIVYPLAVIYGWNVYNQFKATSTPGNPGNAMEHMFFAPISWNIHDTTNVLASILKNFIIISIMFFLSAVITLSSIRSLAGALGGDPDLFGLARLI
ncbi:MAG: hypothetical protein NTY73_02780 [Candidatus Micrarchaeota archaeon]|nr:hypothetical protein [Candidatus Micrarchaeota archaeon]